jgi:hypothetical protein
MQGNFGKRCDPVHKFFMIFFTKERSWHGLMSEGIHEGKAKSAISTACKQRQNRIGLRPGEAAKAEGPIVNCSGDETYAASCRT